MTAPERELTGCPDWCIEEQEHHGDLHESRIRGLDIPERGLNKPELTVGLAKDATDWNASRHDPDVTLHDGDLGLFSIPPSSARSLAALLLHAADMAEGIR